MNDSQVYETNNTDVEWYLLVREFFKIVGVLIRFGQQRQVVNWC